MERKSTGHRRSRATSACLPCRKGRTRCVPEQGSHQCKNCTRLELNCVYDPKDGRKERAAARAEAEALSRRVRQLEELLSKQTQESPPSNRTPQLPHQEAVPSPTAAPDTDTEPHVAQLGTVAELPEASPASARLFNRSSAEDQISVMRSLVPSPIRFDMSSGRVRYFGPTTNMNVLTTSSPSKALERRETHWPLCTVVRDLAPETHDYLMELYWESHNSVVHLVHSDAFYYDMERGGIQFYSVFLHLTMLATGFKYAEKIRKDIQRLVVAGPIGSTLHEKARAMAKLEHDGPGGIPSIQAFALLADINFNAGGDDSGWLFAGMSLRLVSDVGLHVDPAPLNLSEREVQIRHMVLWASLVYDMYWSLYLGRPTTLKLVDIAPACLSKDFTKLICCRPSGHEKKLTTRIYEALLRLMGLISPLCDRCIIARPSRTTETYFKMASLSEELTAWLLGLPRDLKWPPKESKMPSSYYLLHTQYHAILILLHRPFVHYEQEAPSGDENVSGYDSVANFTSISRTICLDNAVRIVEVLEHCRSKLDLSRLYGTGLAHAGTAATALMGEAILRAENAGQETVLSRLSSLRDTIRLMSPTYPPGTLMASVVDDYIDSLSSQKRHGGSEALPGKDVTAKDPVRQLGISQHVDPALVACTGNDDPARGEQPRRRGRPFNPYSFTPAEEASQAVQGLPFLPSSFLEGLNAGDFAFPEQGGFSDYGFSWDHEESQL